MKKVLFLMSVALLIPGMLLAQATLGVYHEGSLSINPPGAGVPFTAYLYVFTDHQVSGIQYMLETPSDPSHAQFNYVSVSYPQYMSLYMGDPWTGHEIVYYPAISTYPNGYAILAEYTFVAMMDCEDMYDYMINVVGDPNGISDPAFPDPDLYGTYPPDMYHFGVTGMSSVVCPLGTPTENESWGAVKSMYK
ncbi:hypothetical protein J7M07_04570 [bacterium]|nr:hypothetical protein [bacterium]